MVIANRLTDGRVVFLAADGQWVEQIAAGACPVTDPEAAELLARGKADEADNRVIDPCLIKIRLEHGVRRPTAWREAIRASGPTVRTDLLQYPDS